MFCGPRKYSTETPKMFHKGANYSTQSVKCSTELLTIPQRMSNVPWTP